MSAFDATYCDGVTSATRPVRAQLAGATLQVRAEGLALDVPLALVEAEPPIGETARLLQLPGGAQLRTADHAAVEALFPRANPLERAVHRLERHWRGALAGVLLVAAFSWWAVVHGLPAAAGLVAAVVPHEVEAALGRRTFASLDGRLCSESKLAAQRQDALQRRFATLVAGLGDGHAYRLHLRDCGQVGANAFALPGGPIVVTDALVERAGDEKRVLAVLAHEVGHVRGRHGLRLALQAAGLAALSAALLGDALSITGLAATLPTLLLQTGYSRGIEAEADEYAFARLKQLGISPAAFAEAMERLAPREAGSDAAALDYLSTHPATARRIERARAAAKE